MEPLDEALTGSPINQKRKRLWEKGFLDEEPAATSPIKPKRKQRWKKDVNRALEEAHPSEGTEEQSKELGKLVAEESKSENLDERLKANEREFLHRTKEANIQKALRGRNFTRKLLKKHDVWWNTTNADYMTLYVPKDAENALRNECIEWVHVHPITGHVGMHGTS